MKMKSALIILCLLAMLTCFQKDASADSRRRSLQHNLSPESSFIWTSTADAEEPADTIVLNPAEARLYHPEFSKKDAALARDADYLAPFAGRYDAGIDIRTYRLWESEQFFSPAIVMVNQRLNNETFYFGFLSISIRF
jgi:hypothetical protein